MLISAAPVAIPVTTANPPTEAVASEAARKVPIPKAAPAADNPNTRNTTENHEQTKNPLDFNRALEESLLMVGLSRNKILQVTLRKTLQKILQRTQGNSKKSELSSATSKHSSYRVTK